MQGGKTMWLIDPVNVSLDSLQKGFMTIAFPTDLNLTDQLFRYGVRVNYDLLQDESCSRIRVNTALAGNPPEYTLHPWYFSPLLTPNDGHEISRNLNQVMAEFASSIDTVSAPGITKTVILSTSPYSRSIKTPAEVSLEMINLQPDRRYFNQKFIPAGILLEGKFQSVFKNRMITSIAGSEKNSLGESQPTKMIVLSDASIIANMVDYSSGKPSIQPLGFDRVSGFTFGNKDFVMNAISYLDDSSGIMQLRNRTIKLRLLDKIKIRENLFWWQQINITRPVLLIVIFGFVYNFIRKRRFAR
jgi:ABC-2 type transport system permease protein